MKKLTFLLIILAISGLLSACSVNYAYVLNHNHNNTQVHLGSNNYQIIKRVSGSATASYVFVFGGLNKKRLYEEAYTEMLKDADLTSGAKALINVLTEERLGGAPPFYYERTVTVSSHVIEFMK
jgi:ABC-type oligopeptide transport system substrate-binding subunit